MSEDKMMQAMKMMAFFKLKLDTCKTLIELRHMNQKSKESLECLKMIKTITKDFDEILDELELMGSKAPTPTPSISEILSTDDDPFHALRNFEAFMKSVDLHYKSNKVISFCYLSNRNIIIYFRI